MNAVQKTDRKTCFFATLALVVLTGVVSMLLPGTALAQRAGAPPEGSPQGSSQGRPHGPPPEALAACKSLASGAACGFSGPRGAVSGTCFAPQQGMALACRPKDAPAPDGAASGPRR